MCHHWNRSAAEPISFVDPCTGVFSFVSSVVSYWQDLDQRAIALLLGISWGACIDIWHETDRT